MGLEMQLPVVKMMNEFFGMRMDMEYLTELRSNLEHDYNMLGDMFRQIHHTSKNINSGVVLKEILYDKLRCKVEVWTNKGQPSTSKVAIKRILDTGARQLTGNEVIPKSIVGQDGKVLIEGEALAKNKYPSLVIYQKYKLLEKELTSIRRLEKKSVKGFFQFYINQSGAGSNRQTSDAHQFSSTMKRCAVSDSPHHGLVSCDFSQVELRILAAMAKEEKLLEMERDCDIDIHRAVWSIISGKHIWDISEEERKAIKSLNFGVVYMMSEYGLATNKYGPAYTKEQLVKERQNIVDFYNGLPNVKEFQTKTLEDLEKYGYVKTAFNYYRYFPELLDPMLDPKLRKRLKRSGNNTPVQGTGAQILKICEVLLFEYIHNKGWDKLKDYDGVMLPMVRMILPIHDEILLSYDKEIPKEEICKMFKECMELDIKGFPPLFASPAFIDNWADGKNAAYEIDTKFRDEIVEEYEKGNYLLTGKDYLKTLTEHRNGEIKSYMDGLIKEYRTVEAVTEHVRHPNFTHVLIETMMPDSSDRKQFTHRERIAESVRRYMEQLEKSGEINVILSQDELDIEVDEGMDTEAWIEGYTHIDQDGNLIDESDEDEEYDVYKTFDEFEEPVEPLQYTPYVYCMSEVFVDISDLDITTNGEVVHQEIMKLTKPDAPYTLYYVQGNKNVRTKYKIEYCPAELDRIFAEVIEGGLTKYGV